MKNKITSAEIRLNDGTLIQMTANAKTAFLYLNLKTADEFGCLLNQQELLQLQDLIHKALKTVMPSKPYIV